MTVMENINGVEIWGGKSSRWYDVRLATCDCSGELYVLARSLTDPQERRNPSAVCITCAKTWPFQSLKLGRQGQKAKPESSPFSEPPPLTKAIRHKAKKIVNPGAQIETLTERVETLERALKVISVWADGDEFSAVNIKQHALFVLRGNDK